MTRGVTVADGRSDSGELAPTIRGPVGLQLASGLTLDLITPKPTGSVHLLDQPQPGLFRGPGRDLMWPGWGRIWPGGGVGMSRSRPPSKLTGWYGLDGRYRTAEASPPISPAASPGHNYATNATKVLVATCASTSTGPADSTNNSRVEPHTATAAH